jgi:LysR family nitrogen assimilation transcriptional regulator
VDLNQLECFVAVADLGSFSKAAIVMQIAQPTLSRTVRSLEVELRQTLFHRNGRGVSLTDPGKRFLVHCRGILVQLERARAELEQDRGDFTGQVVLGFPHSIARVLTVPCALEFKRQFPKGMLRVTEGLTVHLQEWLLAGRLDIALLHDPAPTPALEAIAPLRRENLFLIGRRFGPEVGKGPNVPLKNLARVPLVMPGKPHPVRMLVETQLAHMGLRPNITMEIDSVSGLLDMVEQGAGHAVISLNALAARYGQMRFASRRIVAPELTSVLVLARAAERPATALMQHTLTLLQTLLPNLLPPTADTGMSDPHSS